MIWRASVGVLLEELGELLVDGLLDEPADPRVPELRLRLALELRVAQLDGDHGREPLADVLALEVVLLVLQEALVARVLVERAGQGRLEAGEVRAALGGVDVVREGEDRLDVRGVPLHRDLDVALVVLALEVDDVLVHRVLRLVDERDEVLDAALVVELLRRPGRPLVAQHDPERAREEGRLAQVLREGRGGELRLLEDLAVGQELDRRAVALGRADGLHVALRDAAGELLPVEHPVAAHLGDEPLGERVDDRDADAVEAARDLVAVAAELAAGVKLREHDRERGQALILDHVDRDAGALVDDGDRVVGVNRDVDHVVSAGQRLVDGVVDHLVDEVVQPARTRRSDVHPGAEPDRLEAFQDRDVLCGVIRLGHAA